MAGTIREYISSAEKWLTEAEKTESTARYAALDLRYAIERIVYSKVSKYKDIPTSLYETWQPPQLMNLLVQLEPGADQNATVFFGKEDEYGVPAKEMHLLGNHKTFNIKWLRKNYHKLGSMLHCQWKEQTNPIDYTYLYSILEEIKEVANSPIHHISISRTSEFDCFSCKNKIYFNSEATEKAVIECYNPNCKDQYRRIIQNGKETIKRESISVKCNCGQTISVAHKDARFFYRFSCPHCQKEYEIVQFMAKPTEETNEIDVEKSGNNQ